MSDLIDVKIFIMPNGDEVDLELPTSSTPQDLVASLLEDPDLNIPKTDSLTGEPISYRIMRRSKERDDEEVEIDQEMTLAEQNIVGYAVFSMVPDFVPG